MTIEEAIREAVSMLSLQPINAHLEAELLLAEIINESRTHLKTWPDKKLTADQQTNFEDLVQRRLTGEPIAYILGRREFWDLTLTVTPDTLIPRPETEHLVERALDAIPTDANWRIVDLGTGSGAIALTLASQRPNCHLIATDKSPAALAVAENNAKRLGIHNIEFRLGQWFDCLQPDERVQLIVSNPPYVAMADPHLQQGDLRFEPAQALTAGPLGLDDLSLIIASAHQHLLPEAWLYLEHGFDQGYDVSRLLQEHNFTQVCCYRDDGGHERVSCGQWKNG